MWIRIPYICSLYAYRLDKNNHSFFFNIWKEQREIFIRLGRLETIVTPFKKEQELWQNYLMKTKSKVPK